MTQNPDGTGALSEITDWRDATLATIAEWEALKSEAERVVRQKYEMADQLEAASPDGEAVGAALDYEEVIVLLSKLNPALGWTLRCELLREADLLRALSLFLANHAKGISAFVATAREPGGDRT
jgi:DNA-binding IclR family transcriptional regulator